MKQLPKIFYKVLTLSLLLGFFLLTGFSSLLHNHEVDVSHLDEDCYSCHWVQSGSTMESESAPTLSAEYSQGHNFEYFLVRLSQSFIELSGRSPPHFI